jgi:hypothetical protein
MTDVPNIPSPPQQPPRRWGRWMILGGGGCLLLLVLLVGFVGCLAIIGSSGGGGGGNGGGESASAPPQEGEKAAKFDFYRSKIIQGTDRAGQNDPFEYNMPKPKPGLQPSEETQGVVIFGKTDPSEPLQLSLAWDRGGYMSDRPEPLVFEVTP